ncbi:MAG TPA: glycosyltransferase, partial [Exilispira sp.]|nr:glycosyltransferase [Exilispira sp.]
FIIKYREKKKLKIINTLVKKISNIAYEYLNKEEKEEELIFIDETNIENFKRRKKKEKDVFSRVSESLLIYALNIASERIILPLELRNIEFFIKRKSKLIKKFIRNIKSKSKTKRMKAAFSLRFYGFEGVQILSGFLGVEKSSAIRFKICESLLFAQSYDLIPLILDSAAKEYENGNMMRFSQYIAILQEHAETTVNIISSRYPYNTVETIIGIRLCRYYPSSSLEKILIESLMSEDETLSSKAVNVVYHIIPTMLDSQFFLRHKNDTIRGFAIKSLGRVKNLDNFDRILQFLLEPENEQFATSALENAIKNNDEFKDKLLEIFYKIEDSSIKNKLAVILESYLFYFLENKDWFLNKKINELVEYCIQNGLIYNIVSYLNNNDDIKVEEILILKIVHVLDIVNFKKPDYEKRIKIFEELINSLNEDICQRHNFPPKKKIEVQKAPEASKKDRPLLIALAIFLIFLPVIMYSFKVKFNFSPFLPWLKSFIIFYIKFFGYYALALNLISILFLLFANLEISRQNRLLSSISYLSYFQKGVLPSISVIVPAFREEATIVQNVRSLLALKYPNFEVIVVNDGSPDNTLNVLKQNFELERIPYRHSQQDIDTAPIVGVYKSRFYSNLIVLDKLNGGKADSLNAGINLANCQYVCGIDADSLLEQDALLHAISPIIESDEKIIATGGKIMPVNGCDVENGSLIRIGIGKNFLSRFQTIEYLRAYFTGRLGWSYIKSLLIISGAFGVFEKKEVQKIGGYMTYRTKAKQNTVGEDMELIVRLRRNSIENKEKSLVNYSISATCWTEVPESFKILRKQRDRWQRGLIEILLYHRKMLFNKNYGRVGLIALPYYLIFETLGPFYEVMGLFFSILAIILGIFTIPLFLFLFLTSILLGIFVSILSLAISEKNVIYFNWYEDLLLILIGFLENFGYRQAMNILRLVAYFNYIIGKSSWGMMKRKGFKTQSSRP